MSRKYTYTFTVTGINATGTITTIATPSTLCAEIVEATITPLTNVIDFLAWRFERCTAAISGTTVTGTPHEVGDAAATLTVKQAFAADPAGYTGLAFGSEATFVNNGWVFQPTYPPVMQPSKFMGLRLMTTPAASFDAYVSITCIEIG